MPTLPTFIRSANDLAANVTIGTTRETIHLEFKATIDGWNAPKDDVRRLAQKEMCRDIIQFANTLGGVLLLGVEETKGGATGTRVASGIASVRDIDKLTQWIEQAIVNFVVPSTLSLDISPISTGGGPILAVNIPPSVHLVAVWDRQDHTIEYLYRTNHGKSWMNPDEAEAHLMSSSRAMKLMLEQAVSKVGSNKVEIVGPICRVGSGGGIDEGAIFPVGELPLLLAVHDHHLEIQFHVHSSYEIVLVPLAAIRSAWREGHRTMLLLDGVRIVSRRSKLELVPS